MPEKQNPTSRQWIVGFQADAQREGIFSQNPLKVKQTDDDIKVLMARIEAKLDVIGLLVGRMVAR